MHMNVLYCFVVCSPVFDRTNVCKKFKLKALLPSNFPFSVGKLWVFYEHCNESISPESYSYKVLCKVNPTANTISLWQVFLLLLLQLFVMFYALKEYVSFHLDRDAGLYEVIRAFIGKFFSLASKDVFDSSLTFSKKADVPRRTMHP